MPSTVVFISLGETSAISHQALPWRDSVGLPDLPAHYQSINCWSSLKSSRKASLCGLRPLRVALAVYSCLLAQMRRQQSTVARRQTMRIRSWHWFHAKRSQPGQARNSVATICARRWSALRCPVMPFEVESQGVPDHIVERSHCIQTRIAKRKAQLRLNVRLHTARRASN